MTQDRGRMMHDAYAEHIMHALISDINAAVSHATYAAYGVQAHSRQRAKSFEDIINADDASI